MIEDMPSSPKDPDALVTSFFELIQGHHLTAALDMMSQDCEYDNVPITKVFHHQVASGDLEHGVVMNERTDRFQIDGRWVELDVAGLFVVSESKIALWRDYFDRENFAKALANK